MVGSVLHFPNPCPVFAEHDDLVVRVKILVRSHEVPDAERLRAFVKKVRRRVPGERSHSFTSTGCAGIP
jgi:hypothetical protein